MATIIFIADGWGPKFGGINSFNYDLCLNFATNLDCEKNNVICVTTGDILTEEELEIAKEKELILISLASKDFHSDGICQKVKGYCTSSDVWWVGHDIKTGFYAVDCAKNTKSKCAIIHHMDYSAYYTYIADNPQKTNEKQKKQRELFACADVVFAVGPKLVKSADDILTQIEKDINVIELIPGIADISPIEKVMNRFSAITFGRLNIDEKDIIKQCKLATAAFASACKNNRDLFKGDVEISLIGFDDKDIEKFNDELRQYAIAYANRLINTKGYPYTENRKDLFDSLRRSSVCMMLSLHEGFGLVGWEAVSAGIPLIISENSGLFEFLQNENMDLKVYHIDIKGDLNNENNSEDVDNVSKALIEIKKNLKTYKNTAGELRKCLIEKGYTWSNTALTIIEGLGIESKRTNEVKKVLSVIKEHLSSVSTIDVNGKWEKIRCEFDNSHIYNKVRDAYNDVATDIKNSKFLKIHGMRCSTFCPGNDNPITDVLNKKASNMTVQVSTAYPFTKHIKDRLITLPQYINSEKELLLHQREIYLTADTFKRRKQFNTRFFKSPITFRLYFTQTHLYMSYYEDGVHARELKVFRFDANTETYSAFVKYYEHIWENSTGELPSKSQQVPSEYRYIFSDKWSVKPSLVVNVCADCNMHCSYCPTGGENLIKIDENKYCNNDVLSELIKYFPICGGNSVIRITGGEPLYKAIAQERTNVILNAATHYEKIVLCTNGVYLKDVYEENIETWEQIKNNLLLKISLDTLNKEYFHKITGESVETLDDIRHNIEFIKRKGFKIELNVVVKKQNVHEILEIFEYAKKLELVGIKVLTVNDFGGRIHIDEEEQRYVEDELQNIINDMRKKKLVEYDVSLNDGVGIQMKKFVDTTISNSQCVLTIVDHNSKKNSITPKRTFCEFCKKCSHYPCATGIMNLTLRADGLLSQCRLKEDDIYEINGLSIKEMKNTLKEMMSPFNECFLYEEDVADV